MVQFKFKMSSLHVCTLKGSECLAFLKFPHKTQCIFMFPQSSGTGSLDNLKPPASNQHFVYILHWLNLYYCFVFILISDCIGSSVVSHAACCHTDTMLESQQSSILRPYSKHIVHSCLYAKWQFKIKVYLFVFHS